MEEIFEIVNEDGIIIGRAPRRECHGNPALLHRTVHVLAFDAQGNLWLQKRAPHKDVQPNKWDSSVGGHVDVDESIIDAAKRETREEIGLDAGSLEFCFKYIIRNQIESELTHTFRYFLRPSDAIVIDPKEISEGRIWSRAEIAASMGKSVFTPNFEQEWQRYLQWENAR